MDPETKEVYTNVVQSFLTPSQILSIGLALIVYVSSFTDDITNLVKKE